MPSVKKIETTVGAVRIATGADGVAVVMAIGDSELDVAVNEADLIAAVLEYAHERGVRRTRKSQAAHGSVKRSRKAAALPNGAEVRADA